MMEENFRRIADAVRLPEGSRARIRTQIASHRKEQEASTVKQPKKHLPRLAVAAIIIAAALTLTAAAAAVIHQFRNDILISDLSEIPEPTGDAPTAVAVAEPASDRKAPKTLAERLADGPEITLEEWRNGEKIGGTTSHLYGGWDHAELISDDPALCIRRITRDEDGAEKMQYMAADPADLLPVLTGKIRFDLTWLSENYKLSPWTIRHLSSGTRTETPSANTSGRPMARMTERAGSDLRSCMTRPGIFLRTISWTAHLRKLTITRRQTAMNFSSPRTAIPSGRTARPQRRASACTARI